VAAVTPTLPGHCSPNTMLLCCPAATWRDWQGLNPGAGRIRTALVADADECLEAASRIVRFIQG